MSDKSGPKINACGTCPGANRTTHFSSLFSCRYIAVYEL